MSNFTGSNGDDVANAVTGTVTGFTSGTVAQLQDTAGDNFRSLGTGTDIIVAGSGDDTFSIDVGVLSAGDSFNGGGGTGDRIQIGSANATFDFTNVVLANIELFDAAGGSNDQTVLLTASQFVGFTSVNLGAGTDTLNIVVNGNVDISLATTVPTVNANVETRTISGTSGADTLKISGTELDALIGLLSTSGNIDLGGDADTLVLTSTSTGLNSLSDARLLNVEVVSAAGAAAGVTIDLGLQSEAFTITGSSNADTITGGTAGDTIIGGLGADLLSGGGGDDTFRVTAGDLVAGEAIDGGAGIADTLELLAGSHSLAGVILSGLEAITLANSTLVLGSAAQAGLVTAATGANDTVIFDGYLDWGTQQLWLGQHGVENVQFKNANGTNTVHFNAGVLTSLDIVYNASNTTFQSTTNTYDPSGALVSQHSVYDNSIDELITFTGGVRTSIVRNDLAGGTEFAWTTQTSTYNTSGALTVFEVLNDNGTSQRVEYTNGIRTRDLHTEADGDTYDLIFDASGALIKTISTDVSNSSAGFYSFTNEFSGGHLVKQTTVLDNGTRTVTNYSAATGLKTSYEQYDDAGINANYASLVTTYAANGSTVAKTVYTLDDNGTNQFAGPGGATLLGTSYHDSFRGAAGVADTFVTGPNGGNDYIANFENGLDHVDLAAFGFTSFAQVDAIATGGVGWTYLSFGDGGHLMIAGLSRSSFDAGDLVL